MSFGEHGQGAALSGGEVDVLTDQAADEGQLQHLRAARKGPVCRSSPAAAHLAAGVMACAGGQLGLRVGPRSGWRGWDRVVCQLSELGLDCPQRDLGP